MAEYYELESLLAQSGLFDLDEWASNFESSMLTIVRDGSSWRIHNEQGIELGSFFQRGDLIFIEWQYSSFGPTNCWIATQLIGILLRLRSSVAVRPCTQNKFQIAMQAC